MVMLYVRGVFGFCRGNLGGSSRSWGSMVGLREGDLGDSRRYGGSGECLGGAWAVESI